MKKLLKIKINTLAFLVLLCFGCVSKEEAIRLKYIELEAINDSFKIKMSYRDSLLFNYTTKELLKVGYDSFDYDSKVIKRGFIVNNYTDNIFYSPDKLKCVSFEILETPTASQENKLSIPKDAKKNLYSAIAMIGYRKDTLSIWKIYPLGIYQPNGYTSYKEVRAMMQKEYFQELKGDYYKCNLTDPCFWTEENVIWKKGNTIPEYYDFQVRTNKYYYERDKHDYDLDFFLNQLPKINYPDKILNLYKEEKNR